VCGIAGLIDPSGAPVDRAILERMTRALTHRGPDSEGFFAAGGIGLGHRRLKVIDLSDAAAQPMANEDGTVRLVFNGEIYNFADLRAELLGRGHRFRSRSDSEVLVHGYDAWGDGVLDRIWGMFAFGLWDGRRRRFLAARDRMGKKPFYFAQVRRAGGAPPLFAFGSELKALLEVPGFDRSLDPAALARYLTYEYVPPPRSIFLGARKLDAGERLVLALDEDLHAVPDVRRYWELPLPERHPFWREQDAAAELRTLLRRAVERRLVSDVPLGIFLSGGIDSSTVAAVAAELAGADQLQTFSLGSSDPSFDETAYARTVARHLGTLHHEERLDAKAMLEALPDVARAFDEPLADASVIPTYLLSRFTRRHVTVALGGDGGDELFAGYPTFRADGPAKLFFQALPAPARRWVNRAAGLLPVGTGYFSLDFKVHQFLRGGPTPGPRRHQRWLGSFVPEELDGLLLPEVRADAGDDPLQDVDVRTNPIHDQDHRLMQFYTRFYLANDVLTKVDRASGAVGLEVRAPLLDGDLVEFACRLPPALKLRRLASKYILKRAMRGRLPRGILHRTKQGFAVPVARWMREDLRPALLDELAPDKLRREGLFNPRAVTALLEDHLLGRRDRHKPLWTLFAFERWLATWGKR
jgi:asparagine synthase (glutamine-hydrolysing)